MARHYKYPTGTKVYVVDTLNENSGELCWTGTIMNLLMADNLPDNQVIVVPDSPEHATFIGVDMDKVYLEEVVR